MNYWFKLDSIVEITDFKSCKFITKQLRNFSHAKVEFRPIENYCIFVVSIKYLQLFG